MSARRRARVGKRASRRLRLHPPIALDEARHLRQPAPHPLLALLLRPTPASTRSSSLAPAPNPSSKPSPASSLSRARAPLQRPAAPRPRAPLRRDQRPLLLQQWVSPRRGPSTHPSPRRGGPHRRLRRIRPPERCPRHRQDAPPASIRAPPPHQGRPPPPRLGARPARGRSGACSSPRGEAGRSRGWSARSGRRAGRECGGGGRRAGQRGRERGCEWQCQGVSLCALDQGPLVGGTEKSESAGKRQQAGREGLAGFPWRCALHCSPV